MTAKQNAAVAKIARTALDRAGAGSEFKQWAVQEYGRIVIVQVVAGKSCDEGDLRSVFCRESGVFSVGARGGIRCSTKGAKGRKYPLIYGWTR